MSVNPVPSPAAWTQHSFVWFKGQYDSHLTDGSDYKTQSLAKLWTMKPGDKPKGAGLAMIPSTYADYDAREHAVQRDKGSYIALTGDVDSGNHSLEAIRDGVTAFVTSSAWLIYSSPHARPGDMRWRVILPLAQAQPFEAWHDAQLAFYAFLGARGIECDHALARAAQPVYLPNVPATHAKSETPLRGADGKPLYFQREGSDKTAPGLDLNEPPIALGIAALRQRRLEDEQTRAAIRKAAEQRRAATPRGDGSNLIEDFNAANSVATMLEISGYEQCPRNADDYRSPHQTGETFATRIIGSKWVSLSGSDAAANLGEKHAAGCFGDAYDLYVHFKHGGDHKAAFRALGAEKRAAQGNVAYPPQFHAEPPEWMQEAPAYDAPPEWVDMDGGEVEFEAQEAAAGDTFTLLDLDELENLPPPAWLVHEIVVEDGLTVLYGDPGSGKSFIGLDMALRLTLGMDWHGFATKQVGVLYIAGEGARGLGKRVKGWRREHKAQGINAPFLLLPVPVALLQPDQRAKLMRTIDEATRRAGFTIGLVVVDTVSRSLAGAGENGADEMGAFVAACDDVRLHTGGAVLGIHHSGKDRDKGMRGSSVLLGACDGTIRVEKAEDIVTLTTEKQKDAEAGPPIYMTMKRVGWADTDGDQTTLVPFRTEQRPASQESMSGEQVAKAFTLLNDAWIANKPLSHSPQVRSQGRYAPSVLSKALGCSERLVASYVTSWLENDCLAIEIYDQHSKTKGLRVMAPAGQRGSK